jgi:hypothetical protein
MPGRNVGDEGVFFRRWQQSALSIPGYPHYSARLRKMDTALPLAILLH